MTATAAPLAERANVNPAQVGNGNTEHYTPADVFDVNALCGRRVGRVLTAQQAAKMKRTCTGCTAKAEKIAEAREAQAAAPAVEEEAAPGRYTVEVGANSDHWPTFHSLERAVAHAASYGLTAAAVRDSAGPADIAGARIRCSDGRVRTATRQETAHGREWIHTDDRSAWPADKSELIDTSRIAEVRAVADAAAFRVTSNPDATDPEWRAALDELGEALRYLSDADPLYAAAVAEAEGEAKRVTFTGALADVVPGDIVHVAGIRATVLDTGTAEGSAVRGDRPRWWADVIGVTEEDQRLTFRRPFAVGRFADIAAAEEVTIERPLTAR